MADIHYDPDESPNIPKEDFQRPEGRGLLGTTAGILAGMVLFGVGVKAVKGISHRMSIFTGGRLLNSRWLTDKFSHLKKVANENKTIFDNLIKSKGSPEEQMHAISSFTRDGYFNKSLLGMKDTRLSNIVSNIPTIRRGLDSLKTISSPYTQAAMKFDIAGGFSRGITSATRDKNFGGAMVGKFLLSTKSLATVAVPYYATSQLLDARERGISFNPLENIRRFKDWAPGFATSHFILGGLGMGFKVGAGTMETLAPKIGNTIGGSPFFQKILKGLSAGTSKDDPSFIDKMLINLRAMRTAITEGGMSRVPLFKGVKSPTDFFDRVQQNITNIGRKFTAGKEMARSKTQSPTPYIDVFKAQLENVKAQLPRKNQQDFSNLIEQVMSSDLARRGRSGYYKNQGVISKLFGLKSATKVIEGKEYYLEKGMYKLGDTNIDLRRFLPKNIFQKAIYAGTQLRFPKWMPMIGGTSPFDWMGAQEYLSFKRKPPVQIYKEGDAVILGAKNFQVNPSLVSNQPLNQITFGKGRDTLADSLSESHFLRKYGTDKGNLLVKKAKEAADKGTWMIAPEEMGINIKGSLYRSTSEGSFYNIAPGLEFNPVSWKKGIDYGIRYYGLEKPDLKTAQELYPNSPFMQKMHEKIFKPLEIGKGWAEEGTLLGGVKRFFTKWTSPRSPYNIYGKKGYKYEIKPLLGDPDLLNKVDHQSAKYLVKQTQKMLNNQYTEGMTSVFKHENYIDELTRISKKYDPQSTSLREVFKDKESIVKEIGMIRNTEQFKDIVRYEGKTRKVIKKLESSGAFTSDEILHSRGITKYLDTEFSRNYKGHGIKNLEELQRVIFKDRIFRIANREEAYNELLQVTQDFMNRNILTSQQGSVARTLLKGARIEDSLIKQYHIENLNTKFSKLNYRREQLGILAKNTDTLEEISSRQWGIFTSPNLESTTTGGNNLSKLGYNYKYLIPTSDSLNSYQGDPQTFLRGLLPRLGDRETGKPLGVKGTIKDALMGSPSPSDGLDTITMPGLVLFNTYEKVGRVAEGSFGAAMNPNTSRNLQQVITKWGIKRILPLWMGYQGLQAIDAFTDENAFFENTALEEGTNVFGSSLFVKARLRAAGVYDTLGITQTSKYFESVMPGFVSSPMSAFARGVGVPIVGAALFGPVGAIAGGLVGAASGFGMMDITKSREELEDIYSGRTEVPIRSGRAWELGTSPYEGKKISYFSPNWFAQMRAAPEFTPSLYGSKTEFWKHHPSLDWLSTEPYYYEQKHYKSRPYPVSGGAFDNIPIAGPAMSATVGQFFKPTVDMHQEDLESDFNQGLVYKNNNINNFYQGYNNFPSSRKLPRSTPVSLNGYNGMDIDPMGQKVSHVVNPYGLQNTIGETYYRGITEFPGLRGYTLETLHNELTGNRSLYDRNPVLESSKQMTSTGRWWWDKEFGGLGLHSEIIRRFIPRERSEIEFINPIRNQMPEWLPGEDYIKNFKEGDPYTKVAKGEGRLPGWGNVSLQNVRHDFPVEANIIGKTREAQVQQMLGFTDPYSENEFERSRRGKSIKNHVKMMLESQNRLIKDGAEHFDPKNRITSKMDVIFRNYRGESIPGLIKPVSEKKWREFPLEDDISQMTYHLGRTGQHKGELIYVNKETGDIQTSSVQFNPQRYMQDLQRLQESRKIASESLSKGIGTPGESYSYVDRLKVLSDVAPYSEEYKDMIRKITGMEKQGLLSEEEINKVKLIKMKRDAINRQYHFDEYYSNKDYDPEYKDFLTSINEHIKQDSELNMLERGMRRGWQSFSHMRTPLHTKFLQKESALESWKRRHVYGTESANWNEPYDAFIKPYMREMASMDSPIEGGLTGAGVGYLFGGPLGSFAGSALGAAYGGVNSAIIGITDNRWIPQETKDRWDLEKTMSRVKYEKYSKMAEWAMNRGDSSEASRYTKLMKQTLYGAEPVNYFQVISALPKVDRDYFKQFVKEKDPSVQEEILQVTPDYMQPFLQSAWDSSNYNKFALGNVDWKNIKKEQKDVFTNVRIPEDDWKGYNPVVDMDDVKLKTIQNEGMNTFEFRMGYPNELRKLERRPLTPHLYEGRGQLPIDSSIVKQTLQRSLQEVGLTNLNIFVSSIPGGSGNTVQVNLKEDRTREIQQVSNKYKHFSNYGQR